MKDKKSGLLQYFDKHLAKYKKNWESFAIAGWQKKVVPLKLRWQGWKKNTSLRLQSYGVIQRLAKRWRTFIQQRIKTQPAVRAGTRILCLSESSIESVSFEVTGGVAKFDAEYADKTTTPEKNETKDGAKNGVKDEAKNGVKDGAKDEAKDEAKESVRWCTPARLGAFISARGWSHGSLLLVVPTAGVRHRVVELQGKTAHQVRNALSYQLRGELLEDVGNLVFDFIRLPFSRQEGKSENLVRLFSKLALMEWVSVCEAAGLHVRRVTFSAQALYESLSVSNHNEYVQVYLGQGECLLNHVLGGVLYRSYVLDEKLGSKSSDKELKVVHNKVRAWMKLQGKGDACEVFLSGCYANRFSWSKEAGLRLLASKDKLTKTASPKVSGLLHVLVKNSKPLLGMGEVSFYRGKALWAAWVREHRAGLATALVLSALVFFFGSKNLSQKIQGRQEVLDVLNTKVQNSLGLQGTVSAIAVEDALRRLSKEVVALREQYKEVELLQNSKYEILELYARVSKIVKDRTGMLVSSFRYTGSELVMGGRVNSYADTEVLKEALLLESGWEEEGLTHSRGSNGIEFQLSLKRSSIVAINKKIDEKIDKKTNKPTSDKLAKKPADLAQENGKKENGKKENGKKENKESGKKENNAKENNAEESKDKRATADQTASEENKDKQDEEDKDKQAIDEIKIYDNLPHLLLPEYKDKRATDRDKIYDNLPHVIFPDEEKEELLIDKLRQNRARDQQPVGEGQ